MYWIDIMIAFYSALVYVSFIYSFTFKSNILFGNSLKVEISRNYEFHQLLAHYKEATNQTYNSVP